MRKKPLLCLLAIPFFCLSVNASRIDVVPKSASLKSDRELFQQFGGDVRALLKCAKETQKLVVVAHRGGFAPGFPENALATIERTIEHIPAIIEVDVVASADGVNYLHHDTLLHRTTNGNGKFNSQKWVQIQKLRLRDNDYNLTAQHPLSFDDLLMATRERAFLMLDLKAPSGNEQVIDKVNAAGMLKSSIFIAYNHEQALAILAHEPSALVAFGAASEKQLVDIADSQLDRRPYVALIGDLTRSDNVVKRQNKQGHFLLGSTYYGIQPADAKLVTHAKIPELDNAAKNGFQLVVSNRVFSAYRYLQQNGLAVSACEAD